MVRLNCSAARKKAFARNHTDLQKARAAADKDTSSIWSCHVRSESSLLAGDGGQAATASSADLARLKEIFPDG